MKHQKVSFSNDTACGAKLRTRKAEVAPCYVTCPKCKDLNKHQDGVTTSCHGYYLVGLDAQGEIQTIDGHHDYPSEVQKALELYKQLNLFDEKLTYKMAILERDVKVKITWEIGHYRGEALKVAKDLGLLKLKDVPSKFKPRINKEAARIVGGAVKAYRKKQRALSGAAK